MVRLITLLLFFILSCSETLHTDLSISRFTTEKEKYDQYLIDRLNGFHRLTGMTVIDSSFGIVAIHGYYPPGWMTKGFEWVEPLINLSQRQVPVWFFRHDWNQCADESANHLHEELDLFLDQHSYLDSLWVIGHSLGGNITALFAEQWNLEFPITVHSIAAALGGIDRPLAGYKKIKREKYIINSNVNFTQWKTVKKTRWNIP